MVHCVLASGTLPTLDVDHVSYISLSLSSASVVDVSIKCVTCSEASFTIVNTLSNLVTTICKKYFKIIITTEPSCVCLSVFGRYVLGFLTALNYSNSRVRAISVVTAF